MCWEAQSWRTSVGTAESKPATGTSQRLTQHTRSTKQKPDSHIDLVKGRTNNRAPGDQNHIPTRCHVSSLHPQPDSLSHPALDAIPPYGLSKSAPYGETESIVFKAVGKRREHEQRVEQGTSPATDTFKIGICPQTMLLAHVVAGLRSARGPVATGHYTVKRWRPLSRRAFRTALPPLVFIRARKPCTRIRRRTLGCHVRFGILVTLRSGSQQVIIPAFCCACKSVTRHEEEKELVHHCPSPCPNLRHNIQSQLAVCTLLRWTCNFQRFDV